MDNFIDEKQLKLEELIVISNDLCKKYMTCGCLINKNFYHINYDDLIDRADYILNIIREEDL